MHVGTKVPPGAPDDRMLGFHAGTERGVADDEVEAVVASMTVVGRQLPALKSLAPRLLPDAEADDFSQVPAVKGLSGRWVAAWTQPWTQTAREANLTASVVQAGVDLTVRVSVRSRVVFCIGGCLEPATSYEARRGG